MAGTRPMKLGGTQRMKVGPIPVAYRLRSLQPTVPGGAPPEQTEALQRLPQPHAGNESEALRHTAGPSAPPTTREAPVPSPGLAPRGQGEFDGVWGGPEGARTQRAQRIALGILGVALLLLLLGGVRSLTRRSGDAALSTPRGPVAAAPPVAEAPAAPASPPAEASAPGAPEAAPPAPTQSRSYDSGSRPGAASSRNPAATGASAAFDRRAASSALASAASTSAGCRAGAGSLPTRVRVTFAPDGHVRDASVLDRTLARTSVGQCMESSLRRAVVPPFQGSAVTVNTVVLP